MASIIFKHDKTVPPALVKHILREAGILLPGWNEDRLQRALAGSAVVVTAWDDEVLVGFARAISDFAWCGYLSQLAVLPSHQGKGLGRKLVDQVVAELGEEVSLLVHSVEAPGFYQRIGFVSYQDCYRLKRRK